MMGELHAGEFRNQSGHHDKGETANNSIQIVQNFDARKKGLYTLIGGLASS